MIDSIGLAELVLLTSSLSSGEDHDGGGEAGDGDHRDGEQRSQLVVVGAEYDCGVLCGDCLAHVCLLSGAGHSPGPRVVFVGRCRSCRGAVSARRQGGSSAATLGWRAARGCCTLGSLASRTAARMDFRILGPLEAFDEGRAVMLGGGKQRALLAVFLLHANETLSTDRLIDELWGERPPATAAKTVQVYISRLRKALAGGEGNGPTEHGRDPRARLRVGARSRAPRRAPLRAARRRGEAGARRGPPRARRRGARGGAVAVARPAAGGPRLRAVCAARDRPP